MAKKKRRKVKTRMERDSMGEMSVHADVFYGATTQRAVLNFISGYLGDEEAEYLSEKRYRILYLKYDWLLNDHRK